MITKYIAGQRAQRASRCLLKEEEAKEEEEKVEERLTFRGASTRKD